MVATIKRQFKVMHASGILAQMIRYGFAGGLATLVYSSVYLPLSWTVFSGGRAVMAVPFAFAAALTTGFFLHSKWSFAGHGTRDNSGRQHAKFLMVHCLGLGLNLFFTWTLTAGLAAPTWTPLLPSVTLTPLVTFALQRQWVFS